MTEILVFEGWTNIWKQEKDGRMTHGRMYTIVYEFVWYVDNCIVSFGLKCCLQRLPASLSVLIGVAEVTCQGTQCL